jgi:hypothetical protein
VQQRWEAAETNRKEDAPIQYEESGSGKVSARVIRGVGVGVGVEWEWEWEWE